MKTQGRLLPLEPEPEPEVEAPQAPSSASLPATQQPRSHLDIHVQAVVEVPKPEEVSETQRDVKGTELPVAQREQPQDVQVVLVPPMGVWGQGQEPETRSEVSGVRDGVWIRVPGDRGKSWEQDRSRGVESGQGRWWSLGTGM